MPYYLYKIAGKFPDVTERRLADSELGDEIVLVSGPLDQRPNTDGKWFDANNNLVAATVGPIPPSVAGQLAALIQALGTVPAVGAAIPANLKSWATGISAAPPGKSP